MKLLFLHAVRYRRMTAIALMLLPAAFTAHAKMDAAALQPVQLRCEYREDPVAVDVSRPRLGWISQANDPASRGLRQTAFRILVASRRKTLRQDRGDVWDSGKVATDESTPIRYAGRPLEAHATYYWKVRLWDQDGQPSQWSRTAEFTTGLPTPGDWTAQWITFDAASAQRSDTAQKTDTQSPMGLPMFRREFALTKPFRRATVYVCGLGQYELRLNGQRVGNREMDPGWTNYRKTCLYSGYDVTDLLQLGDNTVGVMLGNGMYNVTGGRYVKFKSSFGAPKLICQMHVTFVDGTTQVMASDESWKCSPGPIIFSCIYGGEDYDARREQAEWDMPSFDASAWKVVRICDGPGGKLVAQTAPPVHMAERLHAVSIRRLEEGKYEVDCGLNLSARPFLKVKGRRGDQVTITCAERQGDPWQGHSYTYTLKGEGEESFRPRFTYFSFQYLYISGADRPGEAEGETDRPLLLEAGSEFITSSATDVGDFRCSNSLLNDIDAMIARSVRSNLQSVLTDCPHREKLGWLEVAHLMGPSILYHQDAVGLYGKICRDTSQSQLASGLVPDIAPEYTKFKNGFLESAEWGSASVQLPALIYQWYGDGDILREQYQTMSRYVRYLASSRNEEGLAKPGLGDWYDWTPETGHGGYSQLTPLELPATAFLYDNARIVAHAAKMMGTGQGCRRVPPAGRPGAARLYSGVL